MLYWNSRPWRGLRIFTLFFMILTGVATLGTGEHYVTDLLVAIPFAVAVQALFGAVSNEIAAIALSSILVSIWFLAILTFPVGGRASLAVMGSNIGISSVSRSAQFPTRPVSIEASCVSGA